MSALLDAAHAKLQAIEAKRDHGNTVVLQRGSEMAVVAIRWLWLHWLAAGKLHVLAGSPGVGKTTVALAMIATVTSGGRWPDGQRSEPGNAVVWSGEDDPADTLLPRLIAMGADVSRVYFIAAMIDGKPAAFDPARDMVQLSAEAAKIGDVRLVLVDPVVSAVVGDSHKNAEVRRDLAPLVELATQLDAAVIGVTHFSKAGSGGDPTQRVIGSVAFSAVARVVLVAAKVKGDDGKDRRILARSKSNVGPDSGGFEYSLDQVVLEGHTDVTASRVLWGAAVDGTARELLAEADADDAKSGGDDRSATDEAVDALIRIIKRDTVPSADVRRQMRADGFSEKVTRAARERIGVTVKRSGFGETMASYWKLPDGTPVPEDEPTTPFVPHSRPLIERASMGTNEAGGHESASDDDASITRLDDVEGF